MTLLDWQSIEIRRLTRGYMVVVKTTASLRDPNTGPPHIDIAFTTIEELATWLEGQGIRCNPPDRKAE